MCLHIAAQESPNTTPITTLPTEIPKNSDEAREEPLAQRQPGGRTENEKDVRLPLIQSHGLPGRQVHKDPAAGELGEQQR